MRTRTRSAALLLGLVMAGATAPVSAAADTPPGSWHHIGNYRDLGRCTVDGQAGEKAKRWVFHRCVLSGYVYRLMAYVPYPR